jgi:hypothetical protein
MAAARALYTKPPTSEEAEMFGLTVEEASGDPVEIWPENVETVNVFISMSTQWRVSMSGPTGLDNSALIDTMRLLGVARSRWPEVFAGIRVMEDVALGKMRETK